MSVRKLALSVLFLLEWLQDARRPQEPSVRALEVSRVAVESRLLNIESVARNVLLTLFCVKS